MPIAEITDDMAIDTGKEITTWGELKRRKPLTVDSLNIKISGILDEVIIERARAYVAAMEIVHADPIAALKILKTIEND